MRQLTPSRIFQDPMCLRTRLATQWTSRAMLLSVGGKRNRKHRFDLKAETPQEASRLAAFPMIAARFPRKSVRRRAMPVGPTLERQPKAGRRTIHWRPRSRHLPESIAQSFCRSENVCVWARGIRSISLRLWTRRLHLSGSCVMAAHYSKAGVHGPFYGQTTVNTAVAPTRMDPVPA